MLIVFECVNQLIPWYIIPGWPQPATYAAQHYVSIAWLQWSSKPHNVYTIGHVVFPADIRYCCGNDCTVLMRVSDWNKMIIASAYTTLMPFACRFTYCCRKICTELGVSEARSVININLITYIYIYIWYWVIYQFLTECASVTRAIFNRLVQFYVVEQPMIELTTVDLFDVMPLILYINGIILSYKTSPLPTRSTLGAQTSAAPSLRSVKQSIQAWNNLVNCNLCPYPENFINIHPSFTSYFY